MVQKQIVCYYAASTLKVIDSQNPLKEYTTKPLYATEDLDEVIGFTSATGSFEFNKINVLAPFICSFYLNDLVFLCSYIKKNNDPIIVSTTYNNVGKGEYLAPATIKREILPPSSPIIQVRKVTITYEEKE